MSSLLHFIPLGRVVTPLMRSSSRYITKIFTIVKISFPTKCWRIQKILTKFHYHNLSIVQRILTNSNFLRYLRTSWFWWILEESNGYFLLKPRSMVWHTYLNKDLCIMVHMSYIVTRVRVSCDSMEYCSRGDMYIFSWNRRRQDFLTNNNHATLSTFDNFFIFKIIRPPNNFTVWI